MLSEISLFLNSMQGSVLRENSQKNLFFANYCPVTECYFYFSHVLLCSVPSSWLNHFLGQLMTLMPKTLRYYLCLFTFLFRFLQLKATWTWDRNWEASFGNYSRYRFSLFLFVICHLVYFIHFLSQNSEGSQKVLVNFWQCHVEDWMILLFVLKIKWKINICPSTSSPTITDEVNL